MGIFLFCLGASFCSISYELILAKFITTLTDDVVLLESLTIGLFVGFCGLGLLVKTGQKKRKNLTDLIKTELYLAFFGSISVPFIMLLSILYRIYIRIPVTPILGENFLNHQIFLFTCEIIPILIGFLSGWELYYLFSLMRILFNKKNYTILLFLYYFGTLLASLVFIYLLNIYCSLSTSACLISLINLSILFFLIKKRILKYKIFFTSILFLNIFFIFFGDRLEQFYLKNNYYNQLAWNFSFEKGVEFTGPKGILEFYKNQKNYPMISRIHSHYQTLDLVWKKNNTFEPYFDLYLDQHFQLSSSNQENYHEFMAHLPMMVYRKKPKRILILGGGDGFLAQQLLFHKFVEEITLIEIDSKMVDLGKSFLFKKINGDSLNSPRLKLKVADAYKEIRNSKTSYDAIYMDFPFPFTFDGKRLYSKEFLKMVSNSLSQDGFIVMDIPIRFDLPKDDKKFLTPFEITSFCGFSDVKIGFQSQFDSFLILSKMPQKIYWSYWDLEIPFKKLNSQWFSSEKDMWIQNDKTKISNNTNSIFKPARSWFYDYQTL